MSLKDVNWGAVVLGAAAVTAIAATGLGTVLAPMVEILTAEGVLAGAAAVGGIIGNMTSKLFERTQDATATLVQR